MGGYWCRRISFKNKHYLCIVDYNSKFPVIKRPEGLSADNLINMVKTIFAQYGIPCKLMLGAGTNLVSDKFHQFCKLVNIDATSSAYHHQSNRQVEACIKFIKCTFKKCADSGRDITKVFGLTVALYSLPFYLFMWHNKPVSSYPYDPFHGTYS